MKDSVNMTGTIFGMLNKADWESEEQMVKFYDQIFLSEKVVLEFGQYFLSMRNRVAAKRIFYRMP